jgi:hypothetical protein
LTLDRPWSRARKTRNALQEAALSSLRGGERQVNSGRIWRWRRDVRLGNLLIEARTTEAKSYRIDYDEFQALTKEAYSTPPGCLPGMQIDIRDLQLICLRFTDFDAFRMHLEDLEEQLKLLKVRE